MKDQINNYFNRYINLSEQELNDFCSCLKIKTFQKNEYLLQEGQVCKNKYFISEGLVRSSYIDKKGNEKILEFGIENWWVTNIDSFSKEGSSQYDIQAIEPTTVLMLSKVNLEKLYHSIPQLERAFRVITENMLIAFQRRNYFFMKKNSKERYNSLIKGIPGFAQRVPQYMIASYLEITPEYLSTIRKNENS